ncbi:hypothetical protein OCU04_008636 [Sclerotinia nivalis]|uniref:non-specific serine/threonine protein kinase n=1 Tax=Sclerotinia nivalis TaxID=352851 RepID=A0A9X0AIH3_9HELO|nr:hypothetical protein OCU04_008636 [Sclerotinia nivalis]
MAQTTVQSSLEMEIIRANPIGEQLDDFRKSFGTSQSLDTINYEDLKELSFRLFLVLQTYNASHLLPSRTTSGDLLDDLMRANIQIISEGSDLDHVKPLLNAVFSSKPDQEIWDHIYNTVAEFLPSPQPSMSFFQQTPNSHITSGLLNSSEYPQDVEKLLKNKLGMIYVGVPQIYNKFFGGVAKLETTSQAFFEKWNVGTDPCFREGWAGWPSDANEVDVLKWLTEFIETLAAFAQDYRSIPTRRTITKPKKLIPSVMLTQRLDIGFVNAIKKDTECDWSQILIPGELKSDPSGDILSEAWIDIGQYVRKVFAVQDTRRFVLGFTICGSFMRIWEFDRLGGIASDKFDINKEGLLFISTILGFLWMNEEELGFDPTIKTTGNQRYIEIERKNRTERLVIDKLIMRGRRIAGRATTCWKAHSETNPSMPLVIKDSWQCLERDEEGELLREATEKNVVNVSRYYHHETIRILGVEDDIIGNIRKGLDITKTSDYPRKHTAVPQNTGSVSPLGNTGKKGSSNQTNTLVPPPPIKRSRLTSSLGFPAKANNEASPSSKRPRLESPLASTATVNNEASLSSKGPTLVSPLASPANSNSENYPNRIHRRVIIRDYGKPIYTASSLKSLLIALEGCIEGHESLYRAGFLHRDISINNLMINEDKKNLLWSSFLIDLDLAIKKDRKSSLDVKEKIGTRAFMAIGILMGHPHSFMHDLESFFWVLFWICIHYDGPDKEVDSIVLEYWNHRTDDSLAIYKAGIISNEQDFLRCAKLYFTPYYQPLVRCVNKLRRVIFPNGQRWKNEDPDLYSSMRKILREASEDQEVANI